MPIATTAIVTTTIIIVGIVVVARRIRSMNFNHGKNEERSENKNNNETEMTGIREDSKTNNNSPDSIRNTSNNEKSSVEEKEQETSEGKEEEGRDSETNPDDIEQPQGGAKTLKDFIHDKEWDKVMNVLEIQPQLAKELVAEEELDILWEEDGPVDVISLLLKIWPETRTKSNGFDRVDDKISNFQWDFVKALFEGSPDLITVENVGSMSMCYNIPLEIFEHTILHRPDAPAKATGVVANLLDNDLYEHVHLVIKHCPDALDVAGGWRMYAPLVDMFQTNERMNSGLILPIVNANPNAAKCKDVDGKYPLHLAYQHEATSDIIEAIIRAYPEAVNLRDNVGRTPKELANLMDTSVFTPFNEALILTDEGVMNRDESGKVDSEIMANQATATTTSYPDNAVVMCKGRMLLRDLSHKQLEEDRVRTKYSSEVGIRHTLFGTLIDEFSKMVGINDKDIIQKAATVQALGAKFLSNQNNTVIDFSMFNYPGYWYQQEILKLVIRLHHEGESDPSDFLPSILHETAEANCFFLEVNDLTPSRHRIDAFEELGDWLVDGLDTKLISTQGPVLKPIQSLFNKLFIRRGQTTVNIVGDMVRATILVDEKETFRRIIEKIEMTFPNISGNQFRQPDAFDGIPDFLDYIQTQLQFLPGSTMVLPYRFKANSSQKKRKNNGEESLWYNLNFFREIPEYHRVGTNEMFVAYELQIGVTDEVNSHRDNHHAYERDRILLSQPLLKNYDDAATTGTTAQRMENTTSTSMKNWANCTDDDIKLIDAILMGKVASEVLVPSSSDNHHERTFTTGPYHLTVEDIYDGNCTSPQRLCLNNRSINWHATDGTDGSAIVIAGPYSLNDDDDDDDDDNNNNNQEVVEEEEDGTAKTKKKQQPKRQPKRRYYIESLIIKGNFEEFLGVLGLYAHIGRDDVDVDGSSSSEQQQQPQQRKYMIQLTCSDPGQELDDNIILIHPGHKKKKKNNNIDEDDDDDVKVGSGTNFMYMEQVCPIPYGTTSLEVIAYGYIENDIEYEQIELKVKGYDVVV